MPLFLEQGYSSSIREVKWNNLSRSVGFKKQLQIETIILLEKIQPMWLKARPGTDQRGHQLLSFKASDLKMKTTP